MLFFFCYFVPLLIIFMAFAWYTLPSGPEENVQEEKVEFEPEEIEDTWWP